jgi:methyltransferase family protein
VPPDEPPPFRTRRRFDYARRLLPNPYLARLEPEELDDPTVAARLFTGQTIGYPAWNLLYYSLLCSLPASDPDERGLLPGPLANDVVVIETGTNKGASTIVMAQVLKDVHLDAAVHTVEIQERVLHVAKAHVSLAGLSEYVSFNLGDSLEFLARMVDEKRHIDFVFLDDKHSRDHVIEEFSIVHPALLERRGTAYFDNTTEDGVAKALESIHATYGGNLVRFDNCSWAPPGNAIWQPA